MEILNVKDLTFKYPLNKNNTLNSVSFSLNKGDFAVLCGQTGSGKTTLLKMLKPSLCPKGDRRGSVLFYGEDLYSKILLSNIEIPLFFYNKIYVFVSTVYFPHFYKILIAYFSVVMLLVFYIHFCPDGFCKVQFVFTVTYQR